MCFCKTTFIKLVGGIKNEEPKNAAATLIIYAFFGTIYRNRLYINRKIWMTYFGIN